MGRPYEITILHQRRFKPFFYFLLRVGRKTTQQDNHTRTNEDR